MRKARNGPEDDPISFTVNEGLTAEIVSLPDR